MKFRSTQKGNRISECYVYLEDTKKDIETKKKYNYCSEECLVIDTLIKDSYDSYVGVGIIDNKFWKKNGVLYSIKEGSTYRDKDNNLLYDITYRVTEIRIDGIDKRVNYEFTYTVRHFKNRHTLDKFIKDLYYNGIIAEIYNN